jgi:hypothetical protein
MKYNIVNVQITHPSFSWSNGLYAVIEKTEKEIKMCKLDENFKLELHTDGSFSITCTTATNNEIYPTPLLLDYDEVASKKKMRENNLEKFEEKDI